jgi:integrase
MANIESRRTDDGKTTYRVKIRIKGHPPQSASFDRLTDARRWAQSTESAIREDRYFKTAEAKRHTLSEAIARYKSEVMPGKRGSTSQYFQLDWWNNTVGTLALADITPAVIAEHRQKLLTEPATARSKKKRTDVERKPRSAATVVRYLAVLSHVLAVAMKEWQWCHDNPAQKISKPKEPRGRVRFLSDQERDGLLNACRLSTSSILHTVVVLAISTGMRQGELMGLHWGQIDFGRTAITLHDTKNGDRRRVPLAGLALELMQDHARVRRIDSDLVFPGKNPTRPAELKKPWHDALTAAEIADFRFHDLRHCTASYLAMNGASLAEIADILGHRTLSMVKRYTHIADSHSAGVVASMNHKVFGHG